MARQREGEIVFDESVNFSDIWNTIRICSSLSSNMQRIGRRSLAKENCPGDFVSNIGTLHESMLDECLH